MLKKIRMSILLVIVMTMLVSPIASASNQTNSSMTKVLSANEPLIEIEDHLIYNVENYLKSLPFTLRRGDQIIVKNIFNKLVLAYEQNDVELAEELYDSLYDVIGDYWMHKDFLHRLIPIVEMRQSVDKMFTEEQKQIFEQKVADLNDLRSEKKFKEYFAKINTIYKFYYDNLGQTIGDSHDELLLITYIKDGDKISNDQLIHYKFDEYLEILPFKISDSDYQKGEVLFKKIVKKIEESLKIVITDKDDDNIKIEKQTQLIKVMKEAKVLTKDLYELLAPYWLTDQAVNILVPHEKFRNDFIKSFGFKERSVIEMAYKDIQDNLKSARKDRDSFNTYFDSIDKYYSTIGRIIREYYDDVFEEIIFVH